MLTNDEPMLKVGDRVINKWSEYGTVAEVINVRTPGKSHRVRVNWEDRFNPDQTLYYEEVFRLVNK